jgi:phosphate transport system permease protein
MQVSQSQSPSQTQSLFLYSSEGISTKKNRFKEKVGFSFLFFSAFLVLGILAIFLSYIFWKGSANAFSFDYLFTPPQGGRNDQGGVLYPLLGTVYLIIASLGIATPIGIFAAVYLSEYSDSKSKLTKLSRFAIESLAGIPSVIFGLFGLAFFVIFLGFKHSLLAAAFSVAIMILPVIIRTAEEAIDSVPKSFRDASYALGANKVQTIFQVVLPSAASGIFTGIMLSIGRAISESAIVILAAGGSVSSIPRIASSFYPYILPDSGRTLALHVYQQNENGQSERAFATAVILILLVLFLNIAATFGLSIKSKIKNGKSK